MRLTVVTGSFAADHIGPHAETRHGHDWHVRAAIPAGAFGAHKNGPQSVLDFELAELDHQLLDEKLPDPSNEGVAEWIGRRLGCAWVYVWRYDKGREFGAEWRP